MRAVALTALLFVILLPSASGVKDPDCIREFPDDLYEYKENYVPGEFDHEPFGMEIADLSILALVLVVATWFSLSRKPSRWISLLMLAALAYFGLFRGGCICPVGATTNFCIGLAAPELIGKVVAVLFLLPLVFSFFFGRVFCSSACPLGAVQHLLSRRQGVALSPRFNAILRLLPIALLVATVWGALRGGLFIACRLDVYKTLFFSGYAWIDQLLLAVQGELVEPRLLLVGDLLAWTMLALALLLGFFVPRPFCRFLCPYGVLLGVISKLGLRSRRIEPSACISCGQCEKACPVQAVSTTSDGSRIVVSDYHCIQCGRCDEACRVAGIKG